MTEPSIPNRRRYPRFMIKFNVVLVSEGVPSRGCRVLDISQGGVLVEWPHSATGPEAPNPLVTEVFRLGDPVDVEFSAALDDGREHFHLPGHVVRILKQRIAVAFRQADSRLSLFLAAHLETAEISQGAAPGAGNQQHSNGAPSFQEASPGQPGLADKVDIGDRIGANDSTHPLHVAPSIGRSTLVARSRKGSEEVIAHEPIAPVGSREKRRRYGTIAAFLVALLAVAILAFDSIRLRGRLAELEKELNGQVELLDVLRNNTAVTSIPTEQHETPEAGVAPAGPPGRPATSQEEPGFLSTATATDRVGPATPKATAPPGEAATHQAVTKSASAQPSVRSEASSEPPKVTPARQANESVRPGDGRETLELKQKTAQAAPPTRGAEPTVEGKWTLHLIALRSKTSSGRLLAKARALGFPVEQVQTSSQGIPLWSLVVTGLDSARSAERYGEEIKSKLDLNGFWISRQDQD